ncbi:MAG: sugar phosphate nucleotidyltransferase [Desulfobacterales bacterium]|jgi:aminoglycoside/choline kinase family phosphotransferase/dTDP-glucose pyrophosphorylase|nr:sugar phosphate nucleotidyltransferase [Desulfobacterales bacterium]
MKALILAAGFGTRLLPFTRHTPKPLFSIGGRRLLDIAIRRLIEAGCRAVMINTHHLHEKIEDFILRQRYEIPVFLKFEPVILGTGGAIGNALDFWESDPFMVINGDIVTDIDLKAVYAHHIRNGNDATLVLCNHSAFNQVEVDSRNRITRFHSEPVPDRKAWTFTGIQVLSSVVLDYIPKNQFSSSIEAYRKMIADGRKIQAYIAEGACWNDIGTPERYRQAACGQMAMDAFDRIFHRPRPAIHAAVLQGDGSDRKWIRMTSGNHSLIAADHGIRNDPDKTAEVDAFMDIGNHLCRKKLPVAQIYSADRFAGLVFLEDLGDQHLEQFVKRALPDTVKKAYHNVIDLLIDFSSSGIQGFDPDWTFETPRYDKRLILERECRYFLDAFVRGYLKIDASFENLLPDFSFIADNALAFSIPGLMHRDFQSRNIMVRNGRFYLIDYQAARIGPIQYDLASLLIDPYVGLAQDVQEELLNYAVGKLSEKTGMNARKIVHGYRFCAITRNLQILGAFAFLSKSKGKLHFEAYISPALAALKQRIATFDDAEIKSLRSLIKSLDTGRISAHTTGDTP